MVAVDKLRGIIYERGMTQRKVAQQIGISEKTFYEKMRKGVFGTDEAAKMAEILEIESPCDIFFAKE